MATITDFDAWLDMADAEGQKSRQSATVFFRERILK